MGFSGFHATYATEEGRADSAGSEPISATNNAATGGTDIVCAGLADSGSPLFPYYALDQWLSGGGGSGGGESGGESGLGGGL